MLKQLGFLPKKLLRLLKYSKIEATAVLFPHQLGIGVQGGSEVIIHSVAAMISMSTNGSLKMGI
jgi:hypothetical protein